MAGEDTRAIPHLFGTAADQLGKLVRIEAQLAQAELSQKLAQITTGATLIGGSAILFIPVLVVLLIGVALWLTRFGLSAAEAHIVVGLVGGAASCLLALAGRKYLAAENLRPRVTLQEVQRDMDAAKEMAR